MKASKKQLRWLSDLCFVLGFVSILGAIVVWAAMRGTGSPEELAHAERFGIFVGLWAPTFFVLSNRFELYAGREDS
jgi:hypothetical protein